MRWISSLNSTAFDQFAAGNWDLWDFTSHPPKTLACTAGDAGKTLYALDCERSTDTRFRSKTSLAANSLLWSCVQCGQLRRSVSRRKDSMYRNTTSRWDGAMIDENRHLDALIYNPSTWESAVRSAQPLECNAFSLQQLVAWGSSIAMILAAHAFVCAQPLTLL